MSEDHYRLKRLEIALLETRILLRKHAQNDAFGHPIVHQRGCIWTFGDHLARIRVRTRDEHLGHELPGSGVTLCTKKLAPQHTERARAERDARGCTCRPVELEVRGPTFSAYY